MVKSKEDNELWMKIKYHVDRGIPVEITQDEYYLLNEWHNQLEEPENGEFE